MLLSILLPMKTAVLLSFYSLNLTLSFGQSQEEKLSYINNKNEVIRELIDNGALRQYYTCYNCSPSEKGTLTFYYNSSELKHILHQYTLGRISYKDEYYIWNNELFFQLSTHTIKYPGYQDRTVNFGQITEVTLTIEDQYYFNNGEPIKCETKSIESRNGQDNTAPIVYTASQAINCKTIDKITKKYNLLLEYQNKHIKNPCDLSRTIPKIIPFDFINNDLNSN